MSPRSMGTKLAGREIEFFFSVAVPDMAVERLLRSYTYDFEKLYDESCLYMPDSRLDGLLGWIRSDLATKINNPTLHMARTNSMPPMQYKMLSSKCIDNMAWEVSLDSLIHPFSLLGSQQQLLGVSSWMSHMSKHQRLGIINHTTIYGPSLECSWIQNAKLSEFSGNWSLMNFSRPRIWQVLVTPETIQSLNGLVDYTELSALLIGTAMDLTKPEAGKEIKDALPNPYDRLLRLLWAEYLLFSILRGVYCQAYDEMIVRLVQFLQSIAPITSQIMSTRNANYLERLINQNCQQPSPEDKALWCKHVSQLYSLSDESNSSSDGFGYTEFEFCHLWDMIELARFTNESKPALARFRLLLIARFSDSLSISMLQERLKMTLATCSLPQSINPFDIQSFISTINDHGHQVDWFQTIVASCHMNEQVMRTLSAERHLAFLLTKAFRNRHFFHTIRKLEYGDSTSNLGIHKIVLQTNALASTKFPIRCEAFIDRMLSLATHFVNIKFYRQKVVEDSFYTLPLSNARALEQFITCASQIKDLGIVVHSNGDGDETKTFTVSNRKPFCYNKRVLETLASLVIKCIALREPIRPPLDHKSLETLYKFIFSEATDGTAMCYLGKNLQSRFFFHTYLNLAEFSALFS